MTQTQVSLTQIQQLTEAFSREHRALTVIVQAVEIETAAVRKRYLKRLMDHIALTAARKAELLAALESSPALFKTPRTKVFDGVKVGYRKLEGKTVIADEDATVAKMQKLFGDDKAAELCTVKITVDKDAVKSLPGDLLKKLGIQITADTDAIVIKTLESEIEKIVAALLDTSDQSDPSEQKEAA